MPTSGVEDVDIAVIGAGPAGVVAALRCARLGAQTVLITRDAFGGMAAADGPVPVRTLAHAARLIREARQLPRYGITASEPSLDYARLLGRVQEVTGEVRRHSLLRADLEEAGVTFHEHAGAARFTDPHRIECEDGPQLRAEKFILCTGGMSRRLALPGFELTCTHSDAWGLSSVPPSLLVVGAGATGVQVASIFNAFGSRVTLFEAAPRILMSEDRDVAEAVGAYLRASGIEVVEHAGTIERFEPCPAGVRLVHSDGGAQVVKEATIAVVAIGWVANTAELNLAAAGVQFDERGYVRVDAQLRTTSPHIFAAGDLTGHLMVVHEAVREGYLAATNAVLGEATALPAEVSPLGSFTDPEYASVGLTEAAARQSHDVIVALERFDSLPRPIIDGRPSGFCKLIVDRRRHAILGCHIVGERAVELAQSAAIAIASGLTVEQLALVPFSFPTYANALARAAVKAARKLDPATASSEASIADEADLAAKRQSGSS
ncbi:MAG: NAD(P)/FAD-dependent oxidoreductase [Solirubrobacterales bacterium]|nr:NAD(P)/FAD-dependent oxidoreductase [Solirubrobacterales bacterium]